MRGHAHEAISGDRKTAWMLMSRRRGQGWWCWWIKLGTGVVLVVRARKKRMDASLSGKLESIRFHENYSPFYLPYSVTTLRSSLDDRMEGSGRGANLREKLTNLLWKSMQFHLHV